MSSFAPTRIRSLMIVLIVTLVGFHGATHADELRNVKRGDAIPEFALPQLDGPEFTSADLKGHAAVIVYVAAWQRRSEHAAAEAIAVCREIDPSAQQVRLVFLTTDADQPEYFQQQRAARGDQVPIVFDAKRVMYGRLGLVVRPTTLVVDSEGRLAHVISSHTPDYRHVVEAHLEHTLGRIDDAALRQRLTMSTIDRNDPEQQIARHRAAARTLQRSGLVSAAEDELRAALAVDPQHSGAQLDLAALNLALGRFEEAEAIVVRVLASNPDHFRARVIHGVGLYQAGKLDEAEAILSSVLALNPDPALAHYYLSLIYERKGETARALEHSKKALSRLIQDLPL